MHWRVHLYFEKFASWRAQVLKKKNHGLQGPIFISKIFGLKSPKLTLTISGLVSPAISWKSIGWRAQFFLKIYGLEGPILFWTYIYIYMGSIKMSCIEFLKGWYMKYLAQSVECQKVCLWTHLPAFVTYVRKVEVKHLPDKMQYCAWPHNTHRTTNIHRISTL